MSPVVRTTDGELVVDRSSMAQSHRPALGEVFELVEVVVAPSTMARRGTEVARCRLTLSEEAVAAPARPRESSWKYIRAFIPGRRGGPPIGADRPVPERGAWAPRARTRRPGLPTSQSRRRRKVRARPWPSAQSWADSSRILRRHPGGRKPPGASFSPGRMPGDFCDQH